MSLLADREFEKNKAFADREVDKASVVDVEFPERRGFDSLQRQKLSVLNGQLSRLKIPRPQNQNVRNPVAEEPKLGAVAGLQIPCAAIGAVFAAADAIAIILSSLIGAEGYQLFASGAPWNLDFHVGAGITAAVLYLLIGKSFGFYQAADIFSLRRNSTRIVWQWLLTSLLLALLAFLFRIGIQFSRASIICFMALGLVSLFASRSLMKAALVLAVKKGRVQGRRVVLVGLRDELANVGNSDLLRRFGLTEVERIAFPNDEQLVAGGEQGYLGLAGQCLGYRAGPSRGRDRSGAALERQPRHRAGPRQAARFAASG